MMFLKISNRGSFNRKFLELIGLTTKRGQLDDSTIIGFKGSGTKLAPVAALRLGLNIAIASSDYLGRYLLRYEVEDVEVDGLKAKQVHFHYDPAGEKDGKPFSQRYPSQMTLDAFPDWDQPIGSDGQSAFKVLREYVCNAYDSGEFHLELVERPELAPPGQTAVYLQYTPAIQALFAEPSRYFKFIYAGTPERPVFSVPGVGEIYAKSESDKTRLFVLGVLVECSDRFWQESLYDYSLQAKSLISEERVIKNTYEYQKELGRLFSRLTDVCIAANVLRSVHTCGAAIEESALGHIEMLAGDARTCWRSASDAVFGAKACVGSGKEVVDKDARQMYGYNVVSTETARLGKFLLQLGLPKAADIVPASNKVEENLDYVLLDYGLLDEPSRQRFEQAFAMFVRHFPARGKWPVVFYYPLTDQLKAAAGYAGLDGKHCEEVWIAAKTLRTLGSVADLVRVLVHETRHCETKVDDYDRAFVGRSDDEVVQLIFREAGRDRYDEATLLPPLGVPGAKPRIVDPARRRRPKR